jgi:hypothetical protein
MTGGSAMKNFEIKGFPGHSSNYIETPDIAELVIAPIFSRCDPDRFRKYATDFQKSLLDLTPLKNNYKYLVIDSYIQLLQPNTCPVGTRSGLGYLHEWHCDGVTNMFDEPTSFHLFQTKCDSVTEFNEHPIEIEIEENTRINRFNEQATLNAEKEWNVKGKKMDNNKFLTFTNHLHRAVQSNKTEFRYFFRVTESNWISPAMDRKQPIDRSFSFRIGDNGTSQRYDSIIHNSNGVFINVSLDHINKE